MNLENATRNCVQEMWRYNVRKEIGAEEMFEHLIIYAVFNGFLILPTVLLNVLIILAVLKTPSLQTPSFILLSSLTLTDIIIGLVIEPLQIAISIIDMLKIEATFCRIILPIRHVSVSLIIASFYTLVAMSFDQFFAIHSKMRYKAIVTKSRVRLIALAIWIFSFACGFLSVTTFVSTLLPFASAIVVLTFIGVCFCYIKSYKTLKTHCTRVASQDNTKNSPSINATKYRTVLTTIGWTFLITMLSYTPTAAVLLLLSSHGVSHDSTIALNYTALAMYIKSIINPLLYMSRMSDLRQATKLLLRKLNVKLCISNT